jgi:hypothetical protein
MTDTTYEGPERIWIAEDEIGNPWWTHERNEDMDEYVRADLVQAAVAAALREAAAHIAPHPDHDRSDWTEYAHQAWRNSRSILAFITPDAQAALDRMSAEQRGKDAKVAEAYGCCHVPQEIAAAIREGGK